MRGNGIEIEIEIGIETGIAVIGVTDGTGTETEIARGRPDGRREEGQGRGNQELIMKGQGHI